MSHYFSKGTSISYIDMNQIDFFNEEQTKSSKLAMKELLKSGDICVVVYGRLAFIKGKRHSAVLNRLGHCIVLSKEEQHVFLQTSLT
ncbi:hypothetical protein LC040_08400 [Bacillus tianshenii]|nr:hypothetical protein LC040_08400 [Bacillus tianshenii]